MLKILYEWVTKPYMQWTFIDEIICTIELLLLAIIGICIYHFIIVLKENKNVKDKR